MSEVWRADITRVLSVEVTLMLAVYISVYFLDSCKRWNLLFNSLDRGHIKKNDGYRNNSFENSKFLENV